MKIRIDGYVVVGPISPWDRMYRDQIISDTAFRSFGRTPAEAWRRHLGPPTQADFDDKSEFGRKVRFYFERGYRLKTATMEIELDSAHEEHDKRGDGSKDRV